MQKAAAVFGIIVGIVIICLSLTVLNYGLGIDDADIVRRVDSEKIELATITPPETEFDEYYGGDAYTGIQQAAAQGANNLIPVFKAIEENNRAIGILNDNLIKQNANTVSNQEIQSVTDAENLRSVAFLVRDCFGYLILALGLFTVAKYVVVLCTPTPAPTKKPEMSLE